MIKYFKPLSVYLCVFSVVLCVIVTRSYAEEAQRSAEGKAIKELKIK